MERNIPVRTSEGGCEILCKHVFAGGLRADEQQIFTAEQCRGGLLPNLTAIVKIVRLRDAPGFCLVGGILGAVFPDALQDMCRQSFFPAWIRSPVSSIVIMN